MCCVTRLGAWLAPLQLSLLGVKSCLVRLVTYTQIKGRIWLQDRRTHLRSL